ncbi:cytochrome P450 [Paxillus ammoniavirescens]|nr:cytochrome P450 [Paxillus ammoniavirescens]
MSRGQALVLDVLCSLGAHCWYNKREPSVSWSLLAQIFVIPLPSALLLTNDSSSVVRAFLTAYTLFLATLFASIVVYRLSPFHPLAKYPGPTLCKVSQFWAVLVASRGKTHLYRKKLHGRYGSIVRIGPNELSVIDKDLLPFILGTHGMSKGPLFEGRRMTPISDKDVEAFTLISSRDPQRHAILRKAWNKAFANSPLRDYEELMLLRARQLIEILHRTCKDQGGVGRVDIATWIGYFSFDFMGDMAFGGGFELMSDGDSEQLLQNMSKALYYPALCQHVPWFARILRNLPYLGTPMSAFGSFGVQRAKIRYSQELKRKDLFYHLIEAYHADSQESPFPLIVSNSLLAIIAGSDTTASVLSNVIYYLLVNPTYYTRLREELDATFPPTEESPLDTDILPSLSMLGAVINEVLRLQPPVPTSLQRAPTRGTGGKMMGTHYIKEGTQIQVPPYVLHRDPRYFFPRPDAFWPDRWLLDVSNSPDLVLDRSAFIPFSMGPANCAGKPLATLELRAVVALLVMHFDMEFDDGFDPETWIQSLNDYFVLGKGRLMVKMKARERQWLAE